MRKYEYNLAGCASDIAPTLTHIGIVSCSDSDIISIPDCLPYRGDWGENGTMTFFEDSLHYLPEAVHIIYLSIVERKFYLINKSLPININDLWVKNDYYDTIIVGMAPFGGVAIWLRGLKKSTNVCWFHGHEILIDIKSFMPNNNKINLEQLCTSYINGIKETQSYIEKNGLPPRDLFDNYMKQFTYRYLTLFEKWNTKDEKWTKFEEENIQPEFDYIEEMLYDGTHDKLHDGGLMKYHEAGKPKKLALKWHIKKSEYSAYFWFDEDGIRAVFDKFYGAHPDTKTDFIIHIDPENRKYELSLYRYGLIQPQIIPESAYQLIVFKNQFEDYRSDNYNQQRGAWIW